MDAKEAIIRIKQHNEIHSREERFAVHITEALDMAIDVLGKQIPQKPIKANRVVKKNGEYYLNDDNEYYKCPVCVGYDVPLREKQEYCHCCGQKIDWS